MSPGKEKTAPATETAAHATTDIDALIGDLAEKQHRLAEHLERDDLSDSVLAQLFSAYGRNAATLGKLLRDRLALSRKSTDDLTAIINQVLDELGKEWNVEL
jgi:hypothetical protein